MKNFLQNHTKTFISLLAKLQEGVIIHAKDTSIIYANPIAIKILGCSEEELLGSKSSNYAWHFIDQDSKRVSPQEYPVNKILTTKNSLEDKLFGVCTSSGETRWVDVSGTISLDKNNEPIVLILMSDVSARKKALERAELFQNLVNSTDIGVSLVDANQEDNPIIYTNDAFSALTGYSREESLGKNCRFLQNDDTDQEAIDELRNAIKEVKSCNVTLRNYTKEGKLFYNYLSVSPYFKNEKLQYFVGLQHDVSKLKEQEIYIQSILNAQSNLVFVHDAKHIIYANSALLAFFGATSLEALLRKGDSVCNYFLEDEEYFHLGKVGKNQNWLTYLHKQEPSKKIVKMHTANQDEKYFQVDVQVIMDSKYVITLNDITHTIVKEKLLTTIAYHDNLTNAFNRQYFYEVFMAQNFTPQSNYAIIMFDIDNFKSLNDTYGHKAGDEVLKSISTRVQKALRSSDAFIRWGGEEFIVVLEIKEAQYVSKIAQKLCDEIASITLKNIQNFTASFGTALVEQNETIDNAIQRADKALYKAKAEGKNRVISL